MTLFGSLPDLTTFEFNVVDNVFSVTVGTMGAAALIFFFCRSLVAPKCRPARLCPGWYGSSPATATSRSS